MTRRDEDTELAALEVVLSLVRNYPKKYPRTRARMVRLVAKVIEESPPAPREE